MDTIGFIVHGKMAGRKRTVKQLEAKFERDYNLKFYITSAPRNAELLTLKAINDQCNFIIAVGGDGTVHEVVNGYLSCQLKEGHSPVIGVLPCGTGNDFARGLGIEKDLDQLAGLISQRLVHQIDAGVMNFKDTDGNTVLRYFNNIADLGIGADVVARVNGVHLRKRILGSTLTFILSVLYTFLTFKHKSVTTEWEGFSWSGKTLGLVIANGPYFGSGFGIAPEAKTDSGTFEVIILGKVSVLDYLKNFKKLRRSEKIDHPEVFYHRSSKISASCHDQSVAVEADGEVEGSVPIEFECLPSVLPFLVPKNA